METRAGRDQSRFRGGRNLESQSFIEECIHSRFRISHKDCRSEWGKGKRELGNRSLSLSRLFTLNTSSNFKSK